MIKNYSDISEGAQPDHKETAQAYLEVQGYAGEWEVRLADAYTLLLDYDQHAYDATLPEQFYTVLSIFEQVMRKAVFFTVHESKGGNTHALVHTDIPMGIYERIAWQAAFGSDPKREALHLLSVERNELNPILLFMRKDQQWSGVDENGNSIVQASSYEIATPQKLLAAGVPQLLLTGEVLNAQAY